MARLPRLRFQPRPDGPDDGSAPYAPSRPRADYSQVETDRAVPFGLRVAGGVAWRVVIVAVALWGLWQAFSATSSVIIPVAVALLLTALLMPAHVLLNRRLGLGRHLAAAITVLGGLALVFAALGLAGNQLVTGLSDLSQQFSQGVAQIQNWLATGPFQVGSEQISDAITQAQQWLRNNSGALTSGAVSAGATAGTFLAGAVISLIATFFFLAEGDSIWSWMVRLLPHQVQTPVHEAFRRGWVSLGSYVKTQVLVAAIDAFFIGLGAFLLGLPLVIPLSLIIFFASAVPIVGALVSGALVVVLALVVKGLTAAIIMLLIVLAVQQLEGNVLQPLLMGKAVALHPLAVLLGVAAFSFLLGIIGALFAVPFLAVTNTVIMYLKGHDMFPMLAQGHSAVEESGKKLAAEDKDAPDQGQAAAHDDRPQTGDIGPDDLEAQTRLDDLRRGDRAASHDEQGS